MILDTGTMLAIIIALAGSCVMMGVFFRRVFVLERTLVQKNKAIIKLQGQLEKAGR